MRYTYWYSFLISTHEVIGICGIHLAFRGIFVSDTYLAIMCEASVAFGCIIVNMYKMLDLYLCLV